MQVDLRNALPVAASGTTATASNAMGGAPCGDGGNNAPDVTYQWTAPADGTYAIDLAVPYEQRTAHRWRERDHRDGDQSARRQR
ncbi:MAG TPA: hypothetical protein VL403_02415 [Candidatus Kryptonia bacterium]|nr:hypothetical protein [Candidatus Kryptonia bacterium]